MMTLEEALKELNLRENFTKEELGKARRDLVKIYNTDDPKHSPDGKEKMQRINFAHDILKEELENRAKRNPYYKEEDLSIIKKETKQSMYEMVDINRNISFFQKAPIFWKTFVNETSELYNDYSNRVIGCNTKEEIEDLQKKFEEALHKRMRQFATQFFRENPHLENKEDKKFETVRNQLDFYQKLLEEERKQTIDRFLSEIYSRVFVGHKILQSKFFPSNWKEYIDKLSELYQEFKKKIEDCTSEKEIKQEKELVDEKISKEMDSFALTFFDENPSFNKHKNREFRKINEQLQFYKELIELREEEKKQTIERFLLEINNRISVADKILYSRVSPSNWKEYIDKLSKLYEEFKKKIENCKSEEEIKQEKELVDEKISEEMNSFAITFFDENPHLNNQKKIKFKTINEQLRFYKDLIEEFQLNCYKKIFSLIESTLEYKIARNLFKEPSLKDSLCKKIQEEIETDDFLKKDIKEVAREIITKPIEGHDYGKNMLCALAFTKEVESVFLYHQCLDTFLTKDNIQALLPSRIINLSTKRVEYAHVRKGLELCKNLVFDKRFYLKEVWKSMSVFVAQLLCQQDFTRNKITNMYLNYMQEVLELANNEIVSVDTLITIEESVLSNYEPEEVLDSLEFALNITTKPITNADYLFIKIEENSENPLAVLHRGKRNYELLFEDDESALQKVEIKNPTRDKIVGYLSVRTVLLNGEFIGKKIGDIDILYLYEGYFLTIDSNGNIRFYKKEQIEEEKFTEGDVILQDPEEILLILCDRANEKYKNLVEEKEMRKKKRRE